MTQRNAFTLIEVMIAIALGLAIIYTAFAAFRTASQAVTVTNRLSTENALLRAAYQQAHEELDFWRMYDDPDSANPTANPLRKRGRAFSLYSVEMPRSGTVGSELERGWVSSDAAFAPHDPRTWLRGNMVEKPNSDLRFGQYAIFACRKTNPTLVDTNAREPWNNGTGPRVVAGQYVVTVNRGWYYNLITDLIRATSNYGFCDYLPANAIYLGYGDRNSSSPNWGGIWKLWIEPGHGDNGGFCNGDGNQRNARGKYRQTYATSFMCPNPLFTGGNLDDDGRRKWTVGYQSDRWAEVTPGNWQRVGTWNEIDVPLFNARTQVPVGLLDGADAGLANDDSEQPQTWPDVTVAVGRFIKNMRSVNICRIKWTSPLTNESMELSFSGFGTTLRGARQQRKPTGGWAKWYGASDPRNDKTLDDY